MLDVDVIVTLPLHAPAAVPYLRPETPCIAADAGIHTAFDLQLNCDAIIGDMDSVHDAILLESLGIPVYRYPTEKDSSDTELALSHAYKIYGERIALVGGNGGRIDHLFSIFSQFNKKVRPLFWITDASCVVFCRDRFSFSAPVGTMLSVFSHLFQPAKCTTQGLRWPFTKLSTTMVSLSNKTIAPSVSIASTSAYFVIFDEALISDINIIEHVYN